MRRPVVFPRIIGLLGIYAAVFALLAVIQFSKRSGFTYRIGNFVVSGHYRDSGPEPSRNLREYAVTDGISVYFGGIELDLSVGGGFRLLPEGEPLRPEVMVLSDEAVLFRLSGGTELFFTTQYSGGAPELRITGTFPPDTPGLELPYKLLRSARLQETAGGQVIQAGGVRYSFGHSPVDPKRQVLTLHPEGLISYRAIPESRAFNPRDFVIPGAGDQRSYDEALTRWRDRSFSLWNRTVGAVNDEDMVIAYAGESVRRGAYKTAVSGIPASFLNGNRRSFESSVYLGRMDMALRSMTAFEREKSTRLSRLINEKSPEFLREPHVFTYLWVRGYGTFIDDGVEMVRTIDPASLRLDATPGILEGWRDWGRYRPNTENPFDRIIDQACFVIAGALRLNAGGDKVFAFQGNEADLGFNLRLGDALVKYGESADNGDWAALGRSLILSALALSDEAGAVPESVTLSERLETAEAGSSRLSSARLYRLLLPGDHYPRAVSVGSGETGLWAWTAASALAGRQAGNVLDISVSFPVGETHYMLIRGVRPFTKLQLYNMDYRTDPQFERYDSSGWSYSASEQTLLLKMKHRTSTEHIVIYY
jgi:hypothetical protein